MTAIKYIQAMKILNKWRQYKDQKRKNKIALQNQILQQQMNSPDYVKQQEKDKQEMEGGDVQYMGGELECSQEPVLNCAIEDRFWQNLKEEEASRQNEFKQASSELNDEESNKTTQEDESTE